MNYKLKDLKPLEEVENIFFVGIKGVGMTPLAIISKEAGLNVAGSDVDEEYITDFALNSSKIDITKGFETTDLKNFFADSDISKSLVITTGAHGGFDNPQSKIAMQYGINVISQGQALGQFMDGDIFEREFKGISIAGSHGKTTITSLLSNTLKELGEDLTYTIGTGLVEPLGLPGQYGHGEYFVAEADEYMSEIVHDRVPKFLYQNPKFAIFNNIDFDHPDIYSSIAEVTGAFVDFAHNIKSNGILFLNSDDPNLENFSEKVEKDIRVVTFGEKNASYRISKIVLTGMSSKFTVYKKDTEVGVFDLNLSGYHNAKNALSVIACLLELGYGASDIRSSLSKFKGLKRRIEKIGKTANGSLIYDDYGHHPNEIIATITSLKNSYPDKKVVTVFQPHTYSRTKSLLSDFAKSFNNSDKLILLPVFPSQRDSEVDIIPQEEITSKLKEGNSMEFISSFDDVVEYINQNFDANYIVLTIGAGDVYKIAYRLKND